MRKFLQDTNTLGSGSRTLPGSLRQHRRRKALTLVPTSDNRIDLVFTSVDQDPPHHQDADRGGGGGGGGRRLGHKYRSEEDCHRGRPPLEKRPSAPSRLRDRREKWAGAWGPQ